MRNRSKLDIWDIVLVAGAALAFSIGLDKLLTYIFLDRDYEKSKPVIETIDKPNLEDKLETPKKVGTINEKSQFSLVENSYLLALRAIESNSNPSASRYEAHLNDTSYGLYQILTNTARDLEKRNPNLPRLGKNIEKSLCDPKINTQYASALLEELYNSYEGDPNLVAAAYNSGPKKPLFARTQEQLNDLYNLKLKCDGVIGKDTRKLIKRFQKENKLKSDGVLGPNTYKKIQELWKKQFPNKPNPKGIVPNIPRVQDYAQRFTNLVESYSN